MPYLIWVWTLLAFKSICLCLKWVSWVASSCFFFFTPLYWAFHCDFIFISFHCCYLVHLYLRNYWYVRIAIFIIFFCLFPLFFLCLSLFTFLWVSQTFSDLILIHLRCFWVYLYIVVSSLGDGSIYYNIH